MNNFPVVGCIEVTMKDGSIKKFELTAEQMQRFKDMTIVGMNVKDAIKAILLSPADSLHPETDCLN